MNSNLAGSGAKPVGYLLHGGRVVDGRGGEPIENGMVLIEGGIIRHVGPNTEIPVGPEIQRVDVSGLTIMPGLIDGHNGFVGFAGILGSVNILRHYLQYGITTAISFHGNPDGNKQLGVPLRDAIKAGLLRGCARIVVGYVVNCTHGHNNGRAADGPWEIRRAVREMVEAGADFIKTAATGGFWGLKEGLHTPNYTQEELNALVDEAHSWGVLVGIHAHADPGLDRAIRSGADLIYHGCLINEDNVEKIVENKSWYLPTLRVTSQRNITGWPDRPWCGPRMQEAQVPHREGVKLAIKRGVKLALGSDGPGSKLWQPGQSTTFEIGELVDCGLTPVEAISVATLATARAYRIDDRVGSLEAGKEADILCVEGNPLSDIRRMQCQDHVALVFQEGRVEYAAGKHRELYSIRNS